MNFFVYNKSNEVGTFYVSQERGSGLLIGEVDWDGLREIALKNLPENKISMAKFRVKNLKEFSQIFLAFRSAFPSLETLQAETIWAVIGAQTEEDFLSTTLVSNKQIMLQENSDEWPGRIEAIRRVSGFGKVEMGISIIPNIGDRKIVIDICDDGIIVTVDYTARPSNFAGDEIKKLVTVAEIYSSAIVYADYDDRASLHQRREKEGIPEIMEEEYQKAEVMSV